MASPKKKASKRRPRKKKVSLRKVPTSRYEFVWNTSRSKCHFGHTSGVGCEVGCGVTDTVLVYTDGKKNYVVLSVNYTEGYGCVEVIGSDGIAGICFADPKDMKELFGDDLTRVAPKDIAASLYAHCMD